VNGVATHVAACLTVAALSSGGCSFAFVRGPNNVAPGRYESGNCSTSRAAPIIDSVLTGVEGFGLLGAFNQTDREYASSVLIVGAALTTLFAASAIYGYAVVRSCRDLKGTEMVRLPYQPREIKASRAQRRAEEAEEEAAVQARMNAKAAADAAAAGEAARSAQPQPPARP
jgi:hypothetical protein